MTKIGARIVRVRGVNDPAFRMADHEKMELIQEACEQGVADALDATLGSFVGDYTHEGVTLRFLAIGDEASFGAKRTITERLRAMLDFALAERGSPITLTKVTSAPYDLANCPQYPFSDNLTATLEIQVALMAPFSSQRALELAEAAIGQAIWYQYPFVMDHCTLTYDEEGRLVVSYVAYVDSSHHDLSFSSMSVMHEVMTLLRPHDPEVDVWVRDYPYLL